MKSPRKTRKRKPRITPILTSTVPDKKKGPDDPHMVGYARVSTSEQSLQRQVDELVKYGVAAVDIFSDKASGKNMDRVGWQHCWLDLQPGDILVVHSLDRLGRNLREVIEIEAQLREKGVTLKALAQDINTGTAAGRLIFHILLTVAQFEREWSLERTMHGLQKARERGVTGGVPKRVPDEDVIAAVTKYGGRSVAGAIGKAAKDLGYSKVTIMRRLDAIERAAKETK
jgi:DNA invertase Pin-like site-specific DNA recombinase